MDGGFKTVLYLALLLVFPLLVFVSCVSTTCPEIGTQVPDFTLKDIDGNNISLSDFKGDTTIIYTWWLGCLPCKQDFILINEIKKYIKNENLTILAIDVGLYDSSKEIKEFALQNGYDYLFIRDYKGDAFNNIFCLSSDSKSRGVPDILLISPSGILIDKRTGGFRDIYDLEKFLGYSNIVPTKSKTVEPENINTVLYPKEDSRVSGFYSDIIRDNDGKPYQIFGRFNPINCRYISFLHYGLPGLVNGQVNVTLSSNPPFLQDDCGEGTFQADVLIYDIDNVESLFPHINGMYPTDEEMLKMITCLKSANLIGSLQNNSNYAVISSDLECSYTKNLMFVCNYNGYAGDIYSRIRVIYRNNVNQ